MFGLREVLGTYEEKAGNITMCRLLRWTAGSAKKDSDHEGVVLQTSKFELSLPEGLLKEAQTEEQLKLHKGRIVEALSSPPLPINPLWGGLGTAHKASGLPFGKAEPVRPSW